jgi:hypothetical protein
MSAQNGDLGIGIDYHPTVAQHKRNSHELTQYISQLKGWKTVLSNSNFEDSSSKSIH